MKIKYLALFLLVILLSSAGASAAGEIDEGLAFRTFDFPAAGRSDPFEVMYPFELTDYGEIRISFRIEEPEEITEDMYQKEVVELVLLDKRAFKDYSPSLWDELMEGVDNYTDYFALGLVKRFFNSIKSFLGMEDEPPSYLHAKISVKDRPRTIIHGVDSSEMEKSDGKYILIMRHKAGFPIKGTFRIRYPGENVDYDPQVDKYRSAKADLLINKLKLNEDNKLVVEMANIGEGNLFLGHWYLEEDERAELEVEIDGKRYYRDLNQFDPYKKLRFSMENVSYTFDEIEINESTEVRAKIDADDVVVEAFEYNNQRTAELPEPLKVVGSAKIEPKGNLKMITPKPDLELESVVLNNRNEIVVRIYNRAAPLSDSHWSGDNRPLLNININGVGAANSSINAFDPNRRLKEKNGFTVHNTGIVLQEAALVRAEIDYLDKLEETDESNNIKEVNLEP
jgi:hypothetical protein